MSTSTVGETFGGVQPPNDLIQAMRKVEPEAIETELDSSWREANASALASGGHAGARNTVMTLVIYANNRGEARRALATLNDPGAQASRAIVIVPTGATGVAPIEAYIATRPPSQEGGATSYSEQIVLMARDGAVQHLPGTLLPLIVAGLPSFFWWMGEPPWRTELLESLMDSSDRLIVDTAAMPQPERSLIALDDLMRRKKSSCAISDLNSARQAPWRELVASFFDTPDMAPYLGAIDQVSIEYAAGAEYASEAPTNTAQAYLFAGWLASRLGWRALGGAVAHGGAGEHEQTLANGVNQKITLQINARYGVALKDRFDVSQVNIPIPTVNATGAGHNPGDHGHSGSGAASVAAGALMLVRLRSTVNGQIGSFTVARETDLEHASTLCQLPLGSQPSQTVHLPTIGETALLTEQLHQLEHDALYEDALAANTSTFHEESSMNQPHTPRSPQITVLADLDAVAHAAAQHFVEAATQAQRPFRVALSGGSTPRRFHELLATAPYRDQVDWSRVEFYWGDERTVPPDDPDSNYKMALDTLLGPLMTLSLITAGQIHRMPGEAIDPIAGAREYADELRQSFGLANGELPRFDLLYLGMGPDGHTLSLFPETTALGVRDQLVVANAVPKLNTTRITISVPVANHAAVVAFLIVGGDKADALSAVLEGPYDPTRYPSQLIAPISGELLFLLDGAAAAKLTRVG